MVARAALVPSHNKQRVVRFCPLRIGIQVALKPRVACRNGTVMHVVVKIRSNERDGRQTGEISRREFREVALDRRAFWKKLPGIMVLIDCAAFDIASESFARSLKDRRERRAFLAMVVIVRDAECASGIQTKVVRLTGMHPGIGVVRQQLARIGQAVDVRRGGAADDLLVIVIFHQDLDDMIESRNACRLGKRRGGRYEPSGCHGRAGRHGRSSRDGRCD